MSDLILDSMPSSSEGNIVFNHSMRNISVRTALPRDSDAAREIAKQLHYKTIFADIPFCDEKWDVGFTKLEENKRFSTLLVAELGSKVIGATYLTVGEYYAGRGSFLNTVHFVAVDDDRLGMIAGKCFVRLLQGAKKWGESRGAERTIVSLTGGFKLKSTSKLMRVLGASVLGGSFVL